MKAPVNAKEIYVAGLDMGWDNPQKCRKEGDRFVLERSLPAGRFQYKFIVEGKWTYCADSPVLQDGDIRNNYIDIVGGEDPVYDYTVRKRLMASEAKMTEEEKKRIMDIMDKKQLS